jgi:hypothetical protein
MSRRHVCNKPSSATAGTNPAKMKFQNSCPSIGSETKIARIAIVNAVQSVEILLAVVSKNIDNDL